MTKISLNQFSIDFEQSLRDNSICAVFYKETSTTNVVHLWELLLR